LVVTKNRLSSYKPSITDWGEFDKDCTLSKILFKTGRICTVLEYICKPKVEIKLKASMDSNYWEQLLQIFSSKLKSQLDLCFKYITIFYYLIYKLYVKKLHISKNMLGSFMLFLLVFIQLLNFIQDCYKKALNIDINSDAEKVLGEYTHYSYIYWI